jgi:hypothetical protein
VAEQSLNFAILRRGWKVTDVAATADPDDYDSLSAVLVSWLQARKYDEALWPQFEAEVRIPGSRRVQARVQVL